MSFFKDFKDDLSQAVNELMPEEAAPSATPQMVDTISESAAPIGQDDLAELINGLDDAAPAADASAVQLGYVFGNRKSQTCSALI